MDLRPAKIYKEKAIMIDQHHHSWSKNKNIFPVIVCAIFVVIAGVVIKVAILRKEKPMDKEVMQKKQKRSQMMAVME